MSNAYESAFDKFFKERTKPLNERFPGQYRALVVETNDPLNIGRVKFRCPELHDVTLPAVDCPWAVPAQDLGGAKAGRFTHPCIGDWVWITFEKQHPYAPMWTGFASPTRRGMYPMASVHSESPPMLNANGDLVAGAADYDKKYLPKDRRPMAHGWVDRYGTADIHSSVGFYPSTHDTAPPPAGHDPLQNTEFQGSKEKPQVNAPDKKYSARITKYGHMFIMGDQGYYWKKSKSGESNIGEFTGDHDADIEWEKKRWLYIQKMINENVPDSVANNGDQRRIEWTTRYGHKIEMRDVGWAQKGPIESKSRQGEYAEPVLLSQESKNDYRWIKIRTKGGMLFQSYDKGFDPAKDKFIQRTLLSEQGPSTEKEDKYWSGKDGRWMRMVSRHGYKIVIDDRGSDPIKADEKDFPRGNGILIKGRRSPGVKSQTPRGNPRGFYWEFNENDQANHTTWGTPMGLAIEMNDRYQYAMISASLGAGWSKKWQGIKENEFLGKPTMVRKPEVNSHHLKLDHDNEYVRLKTRGGKGSKPKLAANPSGVTSGEINQGMEARDGSNGDGPWVEVVDCQRRGLWFSKKYRLGIWRANRRKKMCVFMDENENRTVIYNKEDSGKVIIYCSGSVEVVSKKDISLSAERNVNIYAGNSIRMQGGSSYLTINRKVWTNTTINAERVFADLPNTMPGAGGGVRNPGGIPVDPVFEPSLPSVLEPSDRGKTYNDPFIECPASEIEHPIKK